MLTIRGLTRAFDDKPVLRGIDLDIQQGEILCLLGPSGCGKTTLLRIIAGLEQADSGDVLIEGDSILRIPVHSRDFGLMFQDFALFPHMDVRQNVLFGMRMHNYTREQQEQRLNEVLSLVGLSAFAQRDVSQLSGGEKQRAALARSLAIRPRLLMLDEPLGSLDASLREQLAADLRSIIKRLGLTAIYVTHDQIEAFAIGDRVAIMNAGRIEQVGSPDDIYWHPRTTFVARFLGLNNILSVLEFADGHAYTAIGKFPINDYAASILLHIDGIEVNCGQSENQISGVVHERVFLGSAYRLAVEIDGGVLLSCKIGSRSQCIPEIGEPVNLRVDQEAVIPII